MVMNIKDDVPTCKNVPFRWITIYLFKNPSISIIYGWLNNTAILNDTLVCMLLLDPKIKFKR